MRLLFAFAIAFALASLWKAEDKLATSLTMLPLLGIVTMLDLKKFEESSGYDVVEENVAKCPEIQLFPADYLDGTSMELTVRTDLPTVGFSRINEGVGESKGGYDTRTFSTANLDALVTCDVRLLEGRSKDAAGRYLSAEQSGHTESAMRHIGRQIWYGLKNDAKGFPGLIAQMANDETHVVNVGGGENKKTSVFFLALAQEKVNLLLGNHRTLTFDAWNRQTIKVDDDKNLDALLSWMHFAPGVRLGNRNAMVRIKGITTENGKTLTWDHMQDAYQHCVDDLGIIPTHIFMTGRSRRQLRDLSKTPENPNPELPKDFEGIPIVTSHSISNVEQI